MRRAANNLQLPPTQHIEAVTPNRDSLRSRKANVDYTTNSAVHIRLSLQDPDTRTKNPYNNQTKCLSVAEDVVASEATAVEEDAAADVVVSSPTARLRLCSVCACKNRNASIEAPPEKSLLTISTLRDGHFHARHRGRDGLHLHQPQNPLLQRPDLPREQVADRQGRRDPRPAEPGLLHRQAR